MSKVNASHYFVNSATEINILQGKLSLFADTKRKATRFILAFIPVFSIFIISVLSHVLIYHMQRLHFHQYLLISIASRTTMLHC